MYRQKKPFYKLPRGYAMKEETRSRLRKLKRRIEERLGEKDPLTPKEKSIRDALFRPLSLWFKRRGITANHITLTGICIVTLQNIFMYRGYIAFALFCAILAFLSDMIDGPRARLKDEKTGQDEVTGFGTLADHVRDYYEALSLGIPAFFYAGRWAWPDIAIFILVLLSYALIGIMILYRYFARPAQKTAGGEFLLRHRIRGCTKLFFDFCKTSLQTTGWGRVQFAALAIAVICMFIGRAYCVPTLLYFSYAIFGVEIGIGFRNLVDDYLLEEE
jgi:phosphatidylglycerophosphate synthase